MIAVCIFGIIMIGIVIFATVMAIKQFIDIANISAAAKQKEIDKKSLDFYKQCRKEYVQSLTTEASISKLESVANRFDISDTETAIEYYIRGQELAEEEKKQQLIEEEKKKREKEVKHAKDIEKDAGLIGRNKYIGHAEYLKGMNNVLAGLTELATPRNPMYEKRESTLGAAAKGTFLGGPVMGVANAMRVDSNNNSRSQRQKDYDEHMKKAKEEARALRNDASEYEDEFEEFDRNHIIEYVDTDIYNKFEALSFSNIVCSFTQYGNIKIDGKIKLTKSFEINNHPAKLDGSLRIKVLDENENTVGYGYYCARGKDQMDINYIGFQNSNTFHVICVPTVDDLNPGTTTLHCEIEPYYLWTIAEK